MSNPPSKKNFMLKTINKSGWETSSESSSGMIEILTSLSFAGENVTSRFLPRTIELPDGFSNAEAF